MVTKSQPLVSLREGQSPTWQSLPLSVSLREGQSPTRQSLPPLFSLMHLNISAYINTMENKYILFIDSGIGGLTTLAENMKHMKANYIYFADNKYVPYGSKTTDFIIERLTKIIKFFIKKFNIKIIVLACNTATTTSIFALRRQFKNLIFIGTEPAYKVAIDNKFLHPAILATPQTIQHLKTQNGSFDLLPLENFANKIETYFIQTTYISKLNLLREVFNIKQKTLSNDCLILGCTHYSYLKETLLKITNLPVFDGNYGVSNRILSLSNYTNK